MREVRKGREERRERSLLAPDRSKRERRRLPPFIIVGNEELGEHKRSSFNSICSHLGSPYRPLKRMGTPRRRRASAPSERRRRSSRAPLCEFVVVVVVVLFILTLRTAAGAGAGFFPLGGACVSARESWRWELEREREGVRRERRERRERERERGDGGASAAARAISSSEQGARGVAAGVHRSDCRLRKVI